MPPLGEPSPISVSPSFEFERAACIARDEAADLRNDVCELRVRLEEVQDERNYISAKANELEAVIQSFKKDDVHEELVKKSLQLAEVFMSLDTLQSQIKSLKDEKDQLLLARSADKKKMEELSEVVRSLQCTSSDDEDSDDEEGIVLTPQKALKLTMQNMKGHIEFLEDEHQNLATKCKDHEKKIAVLEKEKEMKDTKIAMLEELFRALNDQRQHHEVKNERETSLSEHLNASTPSRRRERGSRPEMKKASSWAGLVETERRADPSKSRERRMNRRSNSSRGLDDKKQPEITSPKSPNKRKLTTIFRDGQEGAYAGPVVNGQPNGVGTVRFGNGDTYLGEIVNGKLHGKGTLYSKSGVSRGRFENNVFLG